MKVKSKSKASFRDPNGFVFIENNKVFRQINNSYKVDYELFMQSGLYEKLTKEKLLITHKEQKKKPKDKDGFKVIEPEKIPFISYPYEWSFNELKDAALLTLKIQKVSLEHQMGLKDASSYNIAFTGCKPIFIDTLSFKKYKEGSPWVAYKQFCQHFLAPLALMANTDLSLNQLMRTNIDGVPLPLASKLLPKSTYFSFGLLSHIHLHAKTQMRYSGKKVNTNNYKMNKNSLLSLINSLESTIIGLKLKNKKTEWGEYYTFTNYSKKAFNHKIETVDKYISQSKAKTLWDFGANTAEFSKIASKKGVYTVAFDIDPVAVNIAYLSGKKDSENNLLPLIYDLVNPSPGIGWANTERDSIEQRGKPDTVMALALIHHLAISNNLPLTMIAEYFSSLTNYLIIEFVPKEDSQVQKLLSTREDVFPNYTQKEFEKAFGLYFKIVKKDKISGSERTLYLMKNK